MGLSAGTAGSGKPVGNFQAKSSTPAHAKDASAASATKAAVHRMTYRIKRRPGSLPGRSRAFAREPHRLASDLAALVHPRAERFEHGAVDARRIGAMRTHPLLHGREQAGGELAVAGVQGEVRLLGFAETVEPEIRMSAVFDGLGISRLDRQRAIVCDERVLIVAELALGVSEVIPGL